MSFEDVLRRVTVNPAEQLSLMHKIGNLRQGMPADVTVVDIQNGDFLFDDTDGGSRRGKQLIVPVVTIKAGEVIYPNRELAEEESNWSMEGSIAYDEVPKNSNLLDRGQRVFLGRLAESYRGLDVWEGVPLHESFHGTRQQTGIDLRRAAEAVFYSFMTSRFTPPVGFFLALQDRDFVLARLEEVAARAMAHN